MKLTPMMQQYFSLKEQCPDAILFFRLGDFYEMFYDDAELVARELQLTLTSRQAGADQKAPMCGVPHHAAEQYIARLVHKGYRVAICEQTEDPAQARGIVKREITRIVTPGTLFTDSTENVDQTYIVSLVNEHDSWGLSYADLSTGRFRVSTFEGPTGMTQLIGEIAALTPAEGIIAEDLQLPEPLSKRVPCWTVRPKSIFSLSEASKLLSEHFGMDVRSLGLADWPLAVRAAGSLLAYLYETQKTTLRQFTELRFVSVDGSMRLDAATRRSLELTARSLDGSRQGSLLAVLDKTVTVMGRRCLKQWIDFPLVDKQSIIMRQEAVGEWVEDTVARLSLQDELRSVYDIERLGAKVAMRTGTARDLAALRRSLHCIPELHRLLDRARSELAHSLRTRIHDFSELTDLLNRAIEESPPATVHEGGIIREGYDAEVDRLRQARLYGRRWIADLEAKEKERTGIRSLKVGYNKVFGYYIEVSNANLSLVPEHYQRKQTLANAERYITEELKEQETLILEAEQRLNQIEYEIFLEVREQVAAMASELQQTAAAIGELDALLSLAQAAADNNYVRPEIHTDQTLEIVQGRHPVLEKTLPPGTFIPNDIKLGDGHGHIAVITGPNMAGKSTFARQTALIVLMAQIGSFVPARRAVIGIADRIFSRMGASDDISGGLSTFMVEMSEVANILNHATRHSLIILDEVGRGTSTYDGMSIAWAIIEYLHDHIGARTLFTTHYHELTELSDYLPEVRNFTVAIKEDKGDITFLRQVIPGAADRSYGIHVARLAGLPTPVLARARERLQELESEARTNRDFGGTQVALPLETPGPSTVESYMHEEILQQLRQLPLMNMTPIEVMLQVHKWQRDLVGDINDREPSA